MGNLLDCVRGNAAGKEARHKQQGVSHRPGPSSPGLPGRGSSDVPTATEWSSAAGWKANRFPEVEDLYAQPHQDQDLTTRPPHNSLRPTHPPYISHHPTNPPYSSTNPPYGSHDPTNPPYDSHHPINPPRRSQYPYPLQSPQPNVRILERTAVGSCHNHLHTDVQLSAHSERQDALDKPGVVRRLFGDASAESPTAQDAIYKKRSRVDVNYANVHELCALGLSKEQAGNVVAFRVQQRRHFRDKNELKKVPGIDDETWLRLKHGVTLVPSDTCERDVADFATGYSGNAQNHAIPSGFEASRDSLESEDQGVSGGRMSVHLNSCNYHELIVVGFTKLQATAVVNYRVLNGPFTSKEGIRRVPGISEETYTRVHSKLSLAPSGTPRKHSRKRQGGQQRRTPSLAPKSSPVHGVWQSTVSTIFPSFGISSNQSRDTVPSNIPPGARYASLSNTQCKDIERRCDVKALRDVNLPSGVSYHGDMKASPRSRLSGSGVGAVTLRIASWNLQVFTDDKACRPGVLEVICCVIVQHGFDIIAVQEIGSKTSLEKVCQELNNPSLPRIQSMGDNAREWDCCVSSKYTGRMFQGMEYNGFLWNKRSGIVLNTSYMIETDLFVRNPFIGNFAVKQFEFIVVSVHLKAENWGGKDKKRVEEEVGHLPLLIESISLKDSDVILLGDFNMHPGATCFQPLSSRGYSNVLGDGDCTNISQAKPGGSKCYDNIWVSANPRGLQYSGRCGVVRRNLSVPPPRPGERGSTVSDHCPIWAGFTKM